MEIRPLREQELSEIEARAHAAIPGPWYARATDDELFDSAVYVGLRPTHDPTRLSHDNRRGMYAGYKQQEPPEQVVAITVLQNPKLALVGDDRYDENAQFIAHAREDVPRLLDEIYRLRQQLKDLKGATKSKRPPSAA